METRALMADVQADGVYDDDGRLVEVRIRSGDGGELTLEMLGQAYRTVRERMHTSRMQSRLRSREDPRLNELRKAWTEGNGRLTDEYLAALSAVYARGSAEGRRIIPDIADAIDKPPQTVKNHVGEARKRGWLTRAEHGKSSGEVTEATRELLSGMGIQV